MSEYFNIAELQNITPLQLGQVEDAARGLTEEEVCVLLQVDRASFNEVDEQWFCKAFAKGRTSGKKDAVDKLFASMTDKGGKDAALAYLMRFADSWKKDVDLEPKEGTFTFTVKT